MGLTEIYTRLIELTIVAELVVIAAYFLDSVVTTDRAANPDATASRTARGQENRKRQD